MITSCFEGLKRTLILEQTVDSFRIVKEFFGNKDGLIRIKCYLSGGDILEFAEYVQACGQKELIRVTYSYHWQSKSGTLIKRWDNAPHHKELAGFPDHLHNGEIVQSSKPMNLQKVFRVIRRNQQVST